MPSLPWDAGDDLFLVADGTEEVTVTRVNPDTGATLATATAVPAFDPSRRAASAPAGGGEVPDETTTFHLLASAMAFVPKKRDDITRDDGTVWSVDDVGVEGFGTFHVCRATRARA